MAHISEVNSGGPTRSEISRVDLDSHANMIVGGSAFYIIAESGKSATVQAYNPDIPSQEIPIVEAVTLYERVSDGKRFLMVAEHVLSVPSMDHSLIPPFMLREAGVEVDTTPKSQALSPTVETHSLHWPTAQLRVPLLLHGIFSYFPCRRPTREELSDSSIEVVRMTPEGPWNPNSVSYSMNEDNMMDYEGHVIDADSRPKRILLEDVEMEPLQPHIDAVQVGAVETAYLDEISETKVDLPLDNQQSPSLPDALEAQAAISSFAANIGATEPYLESILFPEYDDMVVTPVGELNFDEIMASATTATATRGVDPGYLSKIWKIDLKTAERTVDVTTQRCVRTTADTPFTRNYSTNDRQLRYRRIRTHFFMDTFFATGKAGKSLRGNTCCQLFVTDKGFVYVVPMRTRADVSSAVRAFVKAIGAPDAIICDPAREQKSKPLKEFLNKIGTSLRVIEEGTQWSNRAELYIGLIKAAVRRDMKDAQSPLCLWDYCVERRARINNLTAGNLFQLQGRTPNFHTIGDDGDISNLASFGWYDWCYFHDHKAQFPFEREILGRCLGPATGEGNEMAQWILKANGKVVPRRTVRPLSRNELDTSTDKGKTIKGQMELFDAMVRTKLGGPVDPKTDSEPAEPIESYEDDDEQPFAIPVVEDPVDANGELINQQPIYDTLINAELMLQNAGESQPARVTGRAVNPHDGNIHGTWNENPIMNTIMYDVEFPDGTVKEYAANIIAENILSQVDDQGFTITNLDSVVDHRRSALAIPDDEMYVRSKNGEKRLRKSTYGWDIKVRWHDKSEQWLPLSVMKESNPVEVATYAMSRNIANEPAFAWWVPYTLRKRDVIVASVKARHRKTTHKYGIELPTSVAHAHSLDQRNKDDRWAQALKKEMSNVGIAFDIIDAPRHVPPGWTKVTGHLIFDVKMSLERKARWVLDGHLTPDVDYSTYAGVVSRESVRIALTYAALNGLDVWGADIRNAYVQAPSSRKDYIICGPEFGLENVGKPALIVRALYGGKTAGRDFRNHLRSCMRHLEFKPCPADPDVWMRPATKDDGSEYWEYVLLYTDDCLVMSHRGEHVLRNEIGKYFALKEESIGAPDIYLGGKLRKVELENGLYAWAFGSSQYVNAAVNNVETYLENEKADPLPKNVRAPLSTDYRPEVDVTTALSVKDASQYQSLIGVLRWIVELGRVDIAVEVSMMSSHLALPRIGHLKEVYRIFGYLKIHHNAEMVFDPTVPEIDDGLFQRRDWSTSEVDGELKEELPANMPRARGLGFIMRAFVDADHATDTMTRRSRSGFLIFLNNAPIYWMSKKQTAVETSSFGSEFTAMKLCTEYIRGLRYKLRMMGIACDECAYVFGDNQSVLANTSVPESNLKKKSNSIAYHFIREGCARDEWRTAYVNTHLNPSDILTKSLPYGEKRRRFVCMILHHIYNMPSP